MQHGDDTLRSNELALQAQQPHAAMGTAGQRVPALRPQLRQGALRGQRGGFQDGSCLGACR